jgi:hypothetical protein
LISPVLHNIIDVLGSGWQAQRDRESGNDESTINIIINLIGK